MGFSEFRVSKEFTVGKEFNGQKRRAHHTDCMQGFIKSSTLRPPVEARNQSFSNLAASFEQVNDPESVIFCWDGKGQKAHNPARENCWAFADHSAVEDTSAFRYNQQHYTSLCIFDSTLICTVLF